MNEGHPTGRVTAWLTYRRPVVEARRQPDLGARVGAVGRVLVVDDDVHLADVVSRYLVREGYDVETVGDGTTGLDRALATLPDVLVLDLMLPGLNGLEVFRRLREVAPVPVIMLTARGREEERIAGLELGADDYVGKPFSPRELTARAPPPAAAETPPTRSGPEA